MDDLLGEAGIRKEEARVTCRSQAGDLRCPAEPSPPSPGGCFVYQTPNSRQLSRNLAASQGNIRPALGLDDSVRFYHRPQQLPLSRRLAEEERERRKKEWNKRGLRRSEGLAKAPTGRRSARWVLRVCAGALMWAIRRFGAQGARRLLGRSKSRHTRRRTHGQGGQK